MSSGCAALLTLVVLPLWIAAGVVDWWLHRRSRIEHTSGTTESVFHLCLFAIVSVGAGAVGLLRFNALLIAILIAVFAAHQALTWLELRFVVTRRFVSPAEQMVHSFLELLPFSVALILVIDMTDTAASRLNEWTLQLRDDLQILPLALCAGAVALFNFLPLMEEFLRCRRERTRPEFLYLF
jgi:hypothetical protein